MATQKNKVNTPLKEQLKEANKKYIDCIGKMYLSDFLKGNDVKINDFCQEEYKLMMELDAKVYPNTRPLWKDNMPQ